MDKCIDILIRCDIFGGMRFLLKTLKFLYWGKDGETLFLGLSMALIAVIIMAIFMYPVLWNFLLVGAGIRLLVYSVSK